MRNSKCLELFTSLAQSAERLAFTFMWNQVVQGSSPWRGVFFFFSFLERCVLYGTAFQPLVTAHLYALAMKEVQNEI